LIDTFKFGINEKSLENNFLFSNSSEVYIHNNSTNNIQNQDLCFLQKFYYFESEELQLNLFNEKLYLKDINNISVELKFEREFNLLQNEHIDNYLIINIIINSNNTGSYPIISINNTETLPNDVDTSNNIYLEFNFNECMNEGILTTMKNYKTKS